MNVHYINSSALHSFLNAQLSIRKWERAHIPFLSPQIALDIVIYAAALRLEQRPLPSKNVHLTVGHSADRVREVLSELVAEGWIERVVDPSDRRIRLIRATDKLLNLMEDYAHQTRMQLIGNTRLTGMPAIPSRFGFND